MPRKSLLSVKYRLYSDSRQVRSLRNSGNMVRSAIIEGWVHVLCPTNNLGNITAHLEEVPKTDGPQMEDTLVHPSGSRSKQGHTHVWWKMFVIEGTICRGVGRFEARRDQLYHPAWQVGEGTSVAGAWWELEPWRRAVPMGGYSRSPGHGTGWRAINTHLSLSCISVWHLCPPPAKLHWSQKGRDLCVVLFLEGSQLGHRVEQRRAEMDQGWRVHKWRILSTRIRGSSRLEIMWWAQSSDCKCDAGNILLCKSSRTARPPWYAGKSWTTGSLGGKALHLKCLPVSLV